MNKGLEALNKICDIPIYEDNDNQCSDFGSCCDYKGDLGEVYSNEIEIIEKELKDKEELDRHLDFSDGALMSGFDYKGKQLVAMPLEEYDKLMKETEKCENIQF